MSVLLKSYNMPVLFESYIYFRVTGLVESYAYYGFGNPYLF